MGTSRPSSSSGAFTLIELIVVIAIIGVLMGMLLPLLGRIRRQGQVVASPIVYIGEDQQVRLTSASGSGEVMLKFKSRIQCPVCHAPPTWSPSGSLIALRSFEHKPDPALNANRQDQGYTTIVDPMANTSFSIPEDRVKLTKNFVTWVDSERVVIAERGFYFITNRTNGATVGSMNVSKLNIKQFLFATPVPHGANGAYVGVTRQGSNRHSITFFSKTMAPSRPIYTVTGFNGAGDLAFPRIDPLGEYVGWSQYKTGYSNPDFPDVRNTWRIALKDTRAPSTDRPLMIGDKYFSAAFCDFTENGNILANVIKDGKNWKLVIFDRFGTLMREIDTPTPPAPGIVASWRNFGRR